jgi:hypothetical protein
MLRVMTLAFSLVCTIAVHIVVAPRAGAGAAVWLGAATFVALAWRMVVHERKQPAALEIAPDGIAAFDAAGHALLRGRIAGCTQWTHRLLVLTVAPHGPGRATPLVSAADALSADSFRELAVRARHAAR